MRKYIYLASVFVSLSIAGCDSEKKEQAIQPSVNVTVQKVTSKAHLEAFTVSGKVQASESADLGTRMMGFVASIPVKVGQKVKKGQLLLVVHNDELKAKEAQVNAKIKATEIAFNNATSDLKRFTALFENQSASKKELENVQAQHQLAQANYTAAKAAKKEVLANLSYANILAPFSGVITQVNVKKGTLVNPGQSLISIETQNAFEVVARVAENQIAAIQKNMEVEVFLNSINKTLKGSIVELSASARNTGGQYGVKIALEETDSTLKAGMFAAISMQAKTAPKSKKIELPIASIHTQGQLKGIYTLSESGTAVLRWLRLGREVNGKVEVLSGLTAGETYIVSAEGKLYNGVKVTFKE